MKITVKPPQVKAFVSRQDGSRQEIEEVEIEFLRDINIYYGTSKEGEHVAGIPVKVTYRRKHGGS